MPLTAPDIERVLTSRQEGVKNNLCHILDIHLQDEPTEKVIVNVINKLISTAKCRREGLEHLSQVISFCSSLTLRDNAFVWLDQCIIKFPDDILRELKLRVLGQIVKVCYKEADFNRRFVTNYLSKAFDNCLTTSRVNPYECKAALNTLIILMKFYPSWFGVHKEKIEAYILIFLDSTDRDLVQAAALAFHYLQQVGGAGTNGQNHKGNFTQNLQKLCTTFHGLYAKLIENEGELFSDRANSEGEQFTFNENPSQNSEIVLQETAQRIHNIFEFIQTMIRTGFPVAKELKPMFLLDVVSAALSFHKCLGNGDEQALDDYMFSSILLKIQCTALKLLRLLIIWFQSNFLPFSYLISRLIVESLERTRSCKCYKFHSLYKESAYRALSEWLSVSKSSLHPQFQARLLDVILEEITSEKSQITLTISERDLPGKKSEKARRKAMTNRIISSGKELINNTELTASATKNSISTCKFALNALTSLLEFTNLTVKPSKLKELYKIVFDTLLELQSGKKFDPYTDAQCQAKLYEVLVAIYQQHTAPVLPPLHTALNILSRGVNDKDRFIALVCETGIRFLEEMCQPICPSLYLRVEKDDYVEEVVEVNGQQEDAAASADLEVNHDDEDTQISDSDAVAYQVKYTESDRSTIDEELSERGGQQNEEIIIEELVIVETSDNLQSDWNIRDKPVVTAPSEDGNEVLESHYQDLDRSDTILEEPETQVVTDEPEVKSLLCENPIVQQENVDRTPETEAQCEKSPEAIKVESQKVGCEEPPAKKFRLSTDEETSQSQAEGCENDVKEKDPDDSYLEDDSFVNVVKDYY